MKNYFRYKKSIKNNQKDDKLENNYKNNIKNLKFFLLNNYDLKQLIKFK